MPAHTYLETGSYAKAMAADDRAWRLREQWNAHPEPFALKYAEHDAYSGWSAAMMLGDLQSAQIWAGRAGTAYRGSDLWATWTRFGRWDWIAHSNSQNEFYAPLARGLTSLHRGSLADARSMLALYGNIDADYRWLLQAAIEEHEGRPGDAIASLGRAIAYQQREFGAETLPLFPAGESLGAFYYRAGKFAESRDAFQTTLDRYPNDPRALYGLALAQQKLGQGASAQATLKAFGEIWRQPDPPDLVNF
jgi:tetratricopeptide (TPR) repeat protein